ncbi:NADH-quinone oxidoreductase subunit F, partial [Rhodopseudomonas sp. BR0M22]|nr:NADH-quinone oxidoreductase subunit F [Rhodopseudomonas sp. BR0M22]
MSDKPLTGRARADRQPHSLAAWRGLGGYAALSLALKRPSPEAITPM